MMYELKELRVHLDLPAPTILQARDGVIYRADVTNGGTFRVPAISQAQVGDTLKVRLVAYGTWFTTVEFNEVNLGKPMDFNVQYRSFSQGDSAVASYSLLQREEEFRSSETTYTVKD